MVYQALKAGSGIQRLLQCIQDQIRLERVPDSPTDDVACKNIDHESNVDHAPPSGDIGNVGNPMCGDVMKLYIKVQDNKIVDIKFKTMGCGAAIATSSIITELVKGKTIDEALRISDKAVVDALGGLPKVKYHCSVLAESALKSAIEDYRKKSGKSE